MVNVERRSRPGQLSTLYLLSSLGYLSICLIHLCVSTIMILYSRVVIINLIVVNEKDRVAKRSIPYLTEQYFHPGGEGEMRCSGCTEKRGHC